MSRGLWFAAGAGAGVYAMSKARKVAESLTADGLRDRLRGAGAGARLFREEVRTGRAEREAELRARFGLATPTAPQLAAPAADPAAVPGQPSPKPRSLHATPDLTRDTD